MKRLKHFLLASCLLPGFLAAQGGANAYFLELAPDGRHGISYHRQWKYSYLS